MNHFEYLIVLSLSAFFPVLFTLFHPAAQFRKDISIWLFSIPFVAFFWILADMVQTARGHWSFNEQYTLGIFIGNLPIEETLFFLIVPFCCLFVWSIIRDFSSWSVFWKQMTLQSDDIKSDLKN